MLLLWTAIHEDEEEKFDPSLFKLPLYHNGRFELPNQVFTDDLFNMSSNKSQFLAARLQEKVFFNSSLSYIQLNNPVFYCY